MLEAPRGESVTTSLQKENDEKKTSLKFRWFEDCKKRQNFDGLKIVKRQNFDGLKNAKRHLDFDDLKNAKRHLDFDDLKKNKT